jgi:hypothetical protein
MTLKQFLEALGLRLIADTATDSAPIGTQRVDFEHTRPAVHQPDRSPLAQPETHSSAWEA